MDKLDKFIVDSLSINIQKPQSYTNMMRFTLKNLEDNNTILNKKNMIYKVATVLSIFFVMATTIVFAKDISNWVSNIFHPFSNIENEEKNLKVAEISKLMPHNVTQITFINNMSNQNNPTTYNITDEEKMEKLMSLFTETYWEENNRQESINFDGAFWEIHIIGEFDCTLYMQGRSGLNGMYGKIKIISKEVEKYYNITESIYTQILAFTTEKYYLHDSNLELPTQEQCNKAQNEVFNELTEIEIEKIKKKIRQIHMHFERELVKGVSLIKDPNSLYWEDFTSYGVFSDPFTGIKVDNGGRFLKVLDDFIEIKEISKNKIVIQDLQKAIDILKEGIEEHNLKKCFEAHKIIHDYDYFVINTPVHLEVEPIDWTGVTTYFGSTSIIK